MADISTQLDKIRRSERGEDVRDALTSALQSINNDSPQPDPTSIVIDMPVGQDYHETGGPWNEITVHQAGSGGKTTELKELVVTDNNTEWPKDDEDYDSDKNIWYYSKVKVKVPQLANDVLMDPVEITQNGEYSATEWGVDGLRSIVVNVEPATGDGPFKVEFYAIDNTLLKTEIVAKGGTATCTDYDGVTIAGQTFKGWNPAPSNVTRDMKCYPKFGDIIITPGSIEDDWDTIVLDGGAHYPLGSYRSLVLNQGIDIVTQMSTWQNWGDWYVSGGLMNSIVMDMVKVAEGESGSSSTWISTGLCTFYHNPDDWRAFDNTNIFGARKNADNLDSGVQDWGSSWLRHYLNNDFINDMPLALKNNIKAVTKYYTGRSVTKVSKLSSYAKVEKSSLDKIWVPSVKELYTRIAAIPTDIGSDIKPYCENNGIDYSTIYAPTWRTPNANSLVALRSAYVASTGGQESLAGCGIAIPTTISAADKDYQDAITPDQGNHATYCGFSIGFCL